MLRRCYAVLIRLHPPAFRQRYGDEILAAFDQALTERRAGSLLLDGMISLYRQWLLRTHSPADPLVVPVPGYNPEDVPGFHSCEDSLPPFDRLVTGALVSCGTFFLACLLIQVGGNPPWHLSLDRLPRDPVVAEHDTSWTASTIAPARIYPGTSEDRAVSEFGRHYLRLIRLLDALDRDHDGILSAEEVAHSTGVLQRLDRDHDGSLSPEECGFRGFPPGIGLIGGRDVSRLRPGFMRFHPVIAAIDADEDGHISSEEMARAPAELRKLDVNRDGQITAEEYLPEPVDNELTVLLSHLDLDGDGLISPDERSNEFARPLKELLDAADQNQDGVVSRPELREEIRRRTDLNHDGIVTWAEMLHAMGAGALGPLGSSER